MEVRGIEPLSKHNAMQASTLLSTNRCLVFSIGQLLRVYVDILNNSLTSIVYKIFIINILGKRNALYFYIKLNADRRDI